MEDKITYRFETPAYPGNILYVNVIARYSCINDCLFCSKPKEPNIPNIYEKKAGTSLYLSKSPSVDEVVEAIEKEIKDEDEIAFIGLGEPLIYLPKVVEILKRIKKYKTRIDTNGLVKCMFDNPAKKLEEADLDEIRISLNATNEQDYNELCRPRFKNSFSNLVDFVKDCANSRIETYVSFVVDFKKSKPQQEYIDFAVSLGVKPENIILRKYVEE